MGGHAQHGLQERRWMVDTTVGGQEWRHRQGLGRAPTSCTCQEVGGGGGACKQKVLSSLPFTCNSNTYYKKCTTTVMNNAVTVCQFGNRYFYQGGRYNTICLVPPPDVKYEHNFPIYTLADNGCFRIKD